MKNRMMLAGFLLLLGYGVLVLVSGAPWRVHVARGVTWLPTMLVGCAIFWCQTLNWAKKFSLLAIAIGLGTLLVEYASSRVILKYDFNYAGILAVATFLTLGTMVLVGLTSFIARILTRRLRL